MEKLNVHISYIVVNNATKRVIKIEPIIKTISGYKHSGALFGMISNGSGEGALDLGDGFALKFIRVNDKFLQIALLDYGKKVEMPRQTWQKTKKVIEKKTIIKEVKAPTIKEKIDYKHSGEEEW